MSRRPSDSVCRAAGAFARLAVNGCVAVDRRDELLKACGVARGSWDRVVKALEKLHVLAVERSKQADWRPSAFVVDVARAREVASQASQPHLAREPGTSQKPSRRIARLKSKSKDTLNEKEQQQPHEASQSEPEERARTEDDAPASVAAALLHLAGKVGELVDLLTRPVAPVLSSSPPASPATASVDTVGAPSCECGPMTLCQRGMDGEPFYGCPSWTPGGNTTCGAKTIGQGQWERIQRGKLAAEAKRLQKEARDLAAKAARTEGAPKKRDDSKLGPEHLKQVKEAQRKRNERDPRKEPVAGDVVETGGTARKVASVSEGRVTWDVLGMQGERHSASLEQWVRWGKGATVRTRGVPVVADAVAMLLEGALSAQRQGDASPEVSSTV